MTLQDLINNLSPINTKEKVDTLIQEMKKWGIKRTKNAEVIIRCAIQKVKIQRYVIETYSKLFIEKEETPEKAHNKLMPSLKLTNSPKPAKKKKKKLIAVSKADIDRLKSKLSNEKKKNTKEEQPQESYAIPSIMKVFGSKKNKKMSYKERERIAPHKKEYSTSTKTSLYSIGIPMK